MISIICETILVGIGTTVSMLSIAYCAFLLLERDYIAKEKFEFKEDDYNQHTVFTDIKERKK